MNNIIKTALTHSAIAALIQCVLSVWFGWLAAGWVACSLFLGRELAQHEYKGGGPNNVSLLYGLTHHWTLDSVLDIVLPIITTGVLWILLG